MLKRILPLLLLPFLGYSQGVVWEKSLKKAFEKAAETEKVLFVELYSPTCPYCKAVDPFFEDPQVGELYNKNFINYKLSMDTDEGQDFYHDMDLDVYAIPYFLFFNLDSTLIHTREVSANLNSVLQPGRMVLEGTYASWNYKNRFESGQRTENFLSQYAIFSRIKKDIETNREIIDALWEVYPEEKRGSRISWIITKKAVMDTDNGFVDYWLKNISAAKAVEANSPYDVVEDNFMRIFINTIESDRAKNFDSEKWVSLYKRFLPVFGEELIFSLIWEKQAGALAKEGNQKALEALGGKAFENFKYDPGSLLYSIYVFNPILENTDMIDKWLAAAEPNLSTTGQKLEYYLQLATLRKKQGDTEAAKNAANTGLNLAETNQKSKFEDFLNEL